MHKSGSLGLLLIAFAAMIARSQEVNYDEAKVPTYTLPDPLLDAAGNKIHSAAAWNEHQRGYVFGLVESLVYGVRPADAPEMTVASVSTTASDAIRCRQVTLQLHRHGKSMNLDLLIFLPANTSDPVPTFVGLNFMGNHSVTSRSDVPLTKSWVRNDADHGIHDHIATEASRGSSRSRWPIEAIVGRGYGVATMYYGDIDPDFDDGFQNGIHALYDDQVRDPSSWGSISAWAWGLSFAMDYFEQDEDIDHHHVAVMGHSRLGKTSLWAGATDPRFALVISNDSGCGGAALSRRRFGETVQRINTSFPHWFCDNYNQFNDAEDKAPIDQHSLIALIAPRPVLICSAEEDRWADPKGEFLSGKGAADVYRLLGTDGLAAEDWPGVNTPVMSRIGYHMRPGGHDVKLQDWQVYMDFADKHFGRDRAH